MADGSMAAPRFSFCYSLGRQQWERLIPLSTCSHRLHPELILEKLKGRKTNGAEKH